MTAQSVHVPQNLRNQENNQTREEKKSQLALHSHICVKTFEVNPILNFIILTMKRPHDIYYFMVLFHVLPCLLLIKR